MQSPTLEKKTTNCSLGIIPSFPPLETHNFILKKNHWEKLLQSHIFSHPTFVLSMYIKILKNCVFECWAYIHSFTREHLLRFNYLLMLG